MQHLILQVSFALCLVSLAVIGFYCAAKLSSDHPKWVRLIVLYPALIALYTMASMLQGLYVAYIQDILLVVGFALLYALVASRFSKTPWLDLRVEKTE
jgi:O-antigen/teichoic acid export membrane protein